MTSLTDLAPTNGVTHTRGRQVPALLTYTFRDSDITVQMHKMSPMTINQIRIAVRRQCRTLPPDHEHAYPHPPVQLVAVGGGEPTPQENTGDPQYVQALADWESWANGEVSKRLMRLAAVEYLVVDDAAIADTVERIRRMFARDGIPLDESGMEQYDQAERNRVIYLEHVCYGSPDDMAAFANFLARGTRPTEEQIADATATFRTAQE